MTSAAKSVTPEEGFVDELKPGTPLLHGQYTIRKYLNAGGFGITYLAADSLDRTIVIKECFPGAFCRRSNIMVQVRSRAYQNELGTIVQLFLKEARSLSKLSHPNIVGVHQVFEGNNTAYMALDFIEGEDLFNLIERRDPRLTTDVVRALLEKLLDAIGAVHSAGLLHRDISPDNIILTNALEPVLIDFGAAREQATRKTRALSALRIVKDGYSPQEFYISGSHQGPASDLYSLAATFYHLITGELPPNSQERIAAQVEGRPDPYVPLAKRTSAYDAAFCDAIDRAISILPKSRFQSAHQWLCAISRTANPATHQPQSMERRAPISTPHVPPPPLAMVPEVDRLASPKRTGSGFRAFRVLAGGSAAIVLLIGSVAILGAVRSEDSSAAPASLALVETNGPTLDTASKAEAAAAFKTALGGMAESQTEAPTGTSAVASFAETTSTQPAVVLARETVPGVGVMTNGWTVDLPFTTESHDSLVIASSTGPAAVVLVPGLRITSVEGQPVASLAEAVSVIQAAKPQDAEQAFDVALSLQGADGGEVVVQTVRVPVVHYAELPNGLSFQSRFVEDGWITTVSDAPQDQGSGLRPGDVLVATMPSREPIIDVGALRDVILRDANSGKTAVSIVVRRDGLMWVEDMTLVPTAG
jgi:serine/threonine protein kinase